MNKKLLLLAGILVLGATTFATNGSYTGEVKTRMYQGAGRSDAGVNANKIEWTVGKGSVKMDKLSFGYDVDRDYNFTKDWNKTNEGWDSSFNLKYQGGTFDMMGQEWTFMPTVKFSYDTKENYTSDSSTPTADDSVARREWDFIPTISTTYNGIDIAINPTLAYDTIEETTAFELDITHSQQLSDNWSLSGEIYMDFAMTEKDDNYSNDVFNGNIDDDNRFALSIEEYLGYEKQIEGNLYFVGELGLEAYSILQSEANNVAMYVAPRVEYRAKLDQVTLTPYVMFTSYTSTGDYENTGSSAVNKEELSIGMSFSTKF